VFLFVFNHSQVVNDFLTGQLRLSQAGTDIAIALVDRYF
jgi:hypothetical protein